MTRRRRESCVAWRSPGAHKSQADGAIGRRLAPHAQAIAFAQAETEIRVLLAQPHCLLAAFDLHHPEAAAEPFARAGTQPARDHDAVAVFGEIGEMRVLMLAPDRGAVGIVIENRNPTRHGGLFWSPHGAERNAGLSFPDFRPLSRASIRATGSLRRLALGLDQVAVDQALGDLHRVEGRALAQIVRDRSE